mgnify:CR=1 FL=1|jgi:hypothetical protein
MTNVKCITCRFWVEDQRRAVDHEENRYGRCQRHAPRPGDQHIVWPRTEGGFWCGEHQPKKS